MSDFWKRVSADKENIRFHQAVSFSPYSEYNAKWIGQDADGVIQMSVNGFYRYDSIIQPLFANEEAEKNRKEWLFDIYMHYLTELEYRKGITFQEYQLRKCKKQLENGCYGEEIKRIYTALPEDIKYYIAHALRRQKETGESVNKFAEALIAVLEDGVVYKNKLQGKALLYYLNKKKNEKDMERITLVKQLFLPLGYELQVLWEYHFAVVGKARTMEIDEIELL